MNRPEIVVVKDGAALADEAARRIEAVASDQAWGGTASVALAGGSTPRVAYQHLGSRCCPWAKLSIFFGDERCVPPDDEGSNYRMVREALINRVPFPEANVHRIQGELPPDEGAARAEEDLRRAFPRQDVPRFDLMVLGIGADGHTASLFPGAPELEETQRLTVPVHRPDLPQPWRVSMTLPVLNAAHRVLFLAADAAKGDVVRRAAAGDPALPAGRVQPTDGTETWIVTADVAEAAGLTGG